MYIISFSGLFHRPQVKEYYYYYQRSQMQNECVRLKAKQVRNRKLDIGWTADILDHAAGTAECEDRLTITVLYDEVGRANAASVTSVHRTIRTSVTTSASQACSHLMMMFICSIDIQ